MTLGGAAGLRRFLGGQEPNSERLLDSLRELLCEALEPHSEQDGEELTFTLRWLDAAAPPVIRAWR